MRGVLLGQGGAHADADIRLAAQAHGRQRGVEAALLLAEAVVGLAQAVEADADVVEAGLGDALDVAFVDQRTVARQRHEHPGLARMGGDLEEVRVHQRFAAGEDQHAHSGGAQVVDAAKDFRGLQLATEVAVGGGGVTVLAGQVAAPRQVPDHHRGAPAAGAARRRRVLGEAAQVMADPQHGRSSFCARRRPVFFRMRLLTSISSARQSSPSSRRICWR